MCKPPLSSIAGMSMILLYVVCTIASFALYPTRFTITENYLSDLGNSIFNPHGAVIYNVGIILAGVSLVPFFFGFLEWHSKAVWRTRLLVATQALGFVEAFALVMIGVYPESAGAAHEMWSNVQFFVNLLVLGLGTGALVCDPRFIKAIGAYAIVAIGLQVAALVLIVLGHSSPLVEWLTVLTTMLFVALLSLNMFRAFPREGVAVAS
jgi:hypothetical membrane protein